VGDEIEVRVLNVNRRRRRIELSMVGAVPEEGYADEDDEEAPLTAMELAWQEAMQREGVSIEVSSSKRGRRGRKADRRRQQASIIARTLEDQRE
jgi:hypothetical protein